MKLGSTNDEDSISSKYVKKPEVCQHVLDIKKILVLDCWKHIIQESSQSEWVTVSVSFLVRFCREYLKLSGKSWSKSV